MEYVPEIKPVIVYRCLDLCVCWEVIYEIEHLLTLTVLSEEQV